MYREIVDPDFTWKNFSQEEQLKILAADRSNNELTTQKLQDLYPSLRPIRQAVRETLINMKN
jgi:3,5-epimerase/4-reductase